MKDLDLLIEAGLSTAAATKALTAMGSLVEVSKATETELRAAGVPAKTAAKVSAAFRIGRTGVLRAADKRMMLGRPEDCYAVFRPLIGDLHQEVFLVLSLDIRNQMIDVVEVARGSSHGVEVHPREVFRPGIRCGAAGIVLAHNHPSGDPTPSPEDLELTRRLREVGTIVGIPVIDHLVIAATSIRSIAEHLGANEHPTSW